ncbi:UNVERIFIED_CONTAM: hypothetical protein Slati_3651200 [Sesamum latifolium]|uniref:Uncharacterized protein n=1 Tax=Sesamum latifolium TaxID=2727402 RepID=A0AAW2U074_9LAMI
MADGKSIMDQVHEYENLVADMLAEGMQIYRILRGVLQLEKFPPSWSEYRNNLKQKKRDLTLQEFISHMRTEKANPEKDKLNLISSLYAKANLVESTGFK